MRIRYGRRSLYAALTARSSRLLESAAAVALIQVCPRAGPSGERGRARRRERPPKDEARTVARRKER